MKEGIRKISIKIFLLLAVLSMAAAGGFAKESSGGKCRRIVSLAPSITEVLFKLGLGDKIVAVTRYCRYPAGALHKTKIGGFYDVNYEEILSLKPGTVFLLVEHIDVEKVFKRLGIETVKVNHKSVSGIVDSVRIIGKRCGKREAAAGLVDSLQSAIVQVRRKSAKLSKVRALISVGGGIDLKSAFISGSDGFYSDLLEIAGGKNAYRGLTASVASFSAEGIIKLNPEIIIEIAPGYREKGLSESDFVKKWRKVPWLSGAKKAAKQKKVVVVGSEYADIPGPRFPLLLNELFNALHTKEKDA